MDIIIKSPLRAIIVNSTQEELKKARYHLSYTNKSALFQLRKFEKLEWLKRKDPVGFEKQYKEIQSKVKNCLLYYDKSSKQYWIRPGIIHYLKKFITVSVIKNEINYPHKEIPIPWKKKLPYKPYDYQVEAVEKLAKSKHAHIESGTGTGKSTMLVLLTRKLNLKTIIVTPSKSIFYQLHKEFTERFGRNKVGAYGAGKKQIGKQITVTIAKSLTMLKEGTKEYEFFSSAEMFCGDEAHVLPASTLEKMCNGVLSNVPYRYFFSATQTRGDGLEKLLYSIIGERVFTFSTKDAIKGGYLCPLKFHILSAPSTNKKYTRDPLENKRLHFLYNENIAKTIAKATDKVRGKKSVLILVEELVQIQALISIIKKPVAYIHSASKAEASKYGLEKTDLLKELERFNKGEVRVLIGTRSIATGTNIYPTHYVFNWMGGSSEIATKQGAVGRSTRLLEKSKYKQFHDPKPHSNIIDFVVSNNDKEKKTLMKRLKYYKESSDDISFYYNNSTFLDELEGINGQ